jgi:hypothetical protein
MLHFTSDPAFSAAMCSCKTIAAVATTATVITNGATGGIDMCLTQQQASRSTRHGGRVNSYDTCNFFHSLQDSREVLFIIVCQLI